MTPTRSFDVLVAGSGIAGLFFALRVAEQGSVAVVTKKQAADTATNRAQGGIAAVQSGDDSFDAHVQDTLVAGAGLCHVDVVRQVVERGPAMIEALLELGTVFDRPAVTGPDGGAFDLGQEGGHSHRRILHHRDVTGREIERVLLERARAHPQISLFEDHCAVDLMTTHTAGLPGPDRALGAQVLDVRRGEIELFDAPVTLLATGGAGNIYQHTTNPEIATGDGLAMAYRAGATLANLEFVQFHPTALYHPRGGSFLISETVRGEGGVLRTVAGEALMQAVHRLGDLAPRDVVARAIDASLRRSGDQWVLLDITHRDARFVEERFPNIHKRCLEMGIDMTREPVPVAPAAHYFCGGVRTDRHGESDLPGLFAAGEVACTGLHGANRLASNSLLEALVFADAAARETCLRLAALPSRGRATPAGARPELVESARTVAVAGAGPPSGRDDTGEQMAKRWGSEVRRLMWRDVGIVRTDDGLARARQQMDGLDDQVAKIYRAAPPTRDLVALRDLTTVAGLVIDSALLRQESRGLQHNLDHPRRDDVRYSRDTLLQRPE